MVQLSLFAAGPHTVRDCPKHQHEHTEKTQQKKQFENTPPHTMIKGLSKQFINRVSRFVRAERDQVAAYIEASAPKKRGAFNPYEMFPVQYPWNKYSPSSGLTNADLAWWEKIEKFLVTREWKNSEYRRLGLLYDDTIGDEDVIVIEAINRLPKEIREARERRIARAFDLGLHTDELPESEWTKMEDDVPYLQPYILWVEHEVDELDAQDIATQDFPMPPTTLGSDYESFSGPAFTKRHVE